MRGVKHFIKYCINKLRNHGKNVILSYGSSVSLSTTFEGNNFVGENTIFGGTLGYGSYISHNVDMLAKVGRFCSIAPYVKVIHGTHPTKTIVSTSPFFYSTNVHAGESFVSETIFDEIVHADNNGNPIIIGNDVWIGANVTILSGVTIGDGAIIAAGALVTKDIAPYGIVGGVPAKLIRKRFDDDQIEKMMEFQWWSKDLDWLKAHATDFSDIEKFINNNCI